MGGARLVAAAISFWVLSFMFYCSCDSGLTHADRVAVYYVTGTLPRSYIDPGQFQPNNETVSPSVSSEQKNLNVFKEHIQWHWRGLKPVHCMSAEHFTVAAVIKAYYGCCRQIQINKWCCCCRWWRWRWWWMSLIRDFDLVNFLNVRCLLCQQQSFVYYLQTAAASLESTISQKKTF